MGFINYKIILSFLGITSMINGIFMLFSSIFSWYYKEDAVYGILVSGFLTIFLGFLIWFFNKDARKDIQKREGYLIVTLGWVILILTGTFPYLMTGVVSSFFDAIFESTSGYSTTGSSIFEDVESLPKGILFWRSATHWIGGMGIIVLTIAIFPLLGIAGMQLFVAEAPGPSTDKLHPRITKTAKRLWYIYFGFTFLEFFLLKLAGMSFFDAINHAMATLSTGGFSTKNMSIAHWDGNRIIQYIIIFFMFVAGSNFVLNYHLLKGNISKVLKNEEFFYYSMLIFSTTFIITFFLIFPYDFFSSNFNGVFSFETLESSFRHVIFQIVSILTTTGFVSYDYTLWSSLSLAIIFSLFFFGGSAGSTSGGIKIVRHIVMIKNSMLELKKQLHSRAIISVKYNGSRVSRGIVFNILSFFVIYLLIFILSTIILSFLGLDFYSAIGSAASCLGNVGPGLGKLGPMDNYANLPNSIKLFCSFLMLIGRLEFFTVLIVFTPFFWKKN